MIFVPADSPINTSTIEYQKMFFSSMFLVPRAMLLYAAVIRENSLLKHE